MKLFKKIENWLHRERQQRRKEEVIESILELIFNIVVVIGFLIWFSMATNM